MTTDHVHAEVFSTLSKDVTSMREDLKEVRDAIVGTTKSEGLIHRVARIEDEHKGAKKVAMAAVGSAIVAVVAAAWTWLKNNLTLHP